MALHTKNRVTVAAAAEHAGVSQLTIRRRIKSGDLPAVRLGARILRVDLDDVDALFTPTPTIDLAAFVERTLAEAPPLTDAQRGCITALLARSGAA